MKDKRAKKDVEIPFVTELRRTEEAGFSPKSNRQSAHLSTFKIRSSRLKDDKYVRLLSCRYRVSVQLNWLNLRSPFWKN